MFAACLLDFLAARRFSRNDLLGLVDEPGVHCVVLGPRRAKEHDCCADRHGLEPLLGLLILAKDPDVARLLGVEEVGMEVGLGCDYLGRVRILE